MKITTMTLVLLWISLSGSDTGYQSAPFVLTNLIIGFYLLYRLFASLFATPTLIFSFSGWAIITMVVVLELSALVNGAWRFGPLKIMIWLWYVAVFFLVQRWQLSELPRAAWAALRIYAPLALVFNLANANVMAMIIFTLFMLAYPVIPHKRVGFVALVVCMVYLQSYGGLLACMVVFLSLVWPRERFFVYGAGLLAVGAVAGLFSPDSFRFRIEAWQAALNVPLSGLGPGNFYMLFGWPHSHNFFVTWWAENGIIGAVGLAVAGLLLWVGGQHWPLLVVALGVWSLVDEPSQILLPSLVVVVALKDTSYSKELYR